MGAVKIYHDLSLHYWWCGMKNDIIEFVFKCLICQQVKCEHQRLEVSFKGCHFLMKVRADHYGLHGGLPIIIGGYDSIWVIMDYLNMFTHFIFVKVKYTTKRMSYLYISQIVRLHGVPIYVVSIGVL